MRRSRAIRLGAVWAVAGLAPGLGCTHNHYYYTAPVGAPAGACDPAAPGVVVSSTSPVANAPRVGDICEEPPQGRGPFGTQVVQGPTSPAPVASNAGSPLVPRPIYSQPRGPAPRRPIGSGLAWRASSQEGSATTRIVGAYDDDSTVR